MTVAPRGGTRPRLARFSIPYRFAESSVRCASNVCDRPGSRLSVSTPIPAMSRSSSSYSTAAFEKPGHWVSCTYFLAKFPVAAPCAVTRSDQVAETAQAIEGLLPGPKGLANAHHLGKCTGDERGLGIVA